MERDSRRYPRQHTQTLVSYTHFMADGGVDDQGMGKLLDLSLEGLSFQCRRSFEVGSRVDVEVQLRNDLVDVSGTVTRVGAEGEDHAIGLSIERASPNYASVLREYLGST